METVVATSNVQEIAKGKMAELVEVIEAQTTSTDTDFVDNMYDYKEDFSPQALKTISRIHSSWLR